METIQFKNCHVNIDDEAEYLETVFPQANGAKVPATANYDEESIARAKALGYASTWEMSREHEILHTEVAEAMGYPYSVVLHAVAFGYKLPQDVIDREERLILWIQKRLNDERRKV